MRKKRKAPRRLLFVLISFVLFAGAFFIIEYYAVPIISPQAFETAGNGGAGLASALSSKEITEVSAAQAPETEIETKEETAAETEAETQPQPQTQTETETVEGTSSGPVYITVPRFYNLSEAQAQDYLAGYGLKCASDADYNINAKGTVYKLLFSGTYDDDNFYISAGSTVTLMVSLGRHTRPNAAPAAENTVYLTFDDGPTKTNTYRVLEILDKYDIKATFFMVGCFANVYTKQVKAVYDAGHVLGCHSYTHKYQDLYGSSQVFKDEILQWETAVYKTTGDLPYKLFRFPGGSAQARNGYDHYRELIGTLDELGYVAYDWTLTNSDSFAVKYAGNQTPQDYVKQAFLNQLDTAERSPSRPKIILMHETKDYTVDTLEWAIETLIDRGYNFDTLDNLGGEWINSY